MRKILAYLLSFIIAFLCSVNIWAKDKYTVAILPFSINSAENIDYIKQGVEAMLSSRIAASDKINVVNKDTVNDELKKLKIKEISQNDIYTVGAKLNSDFVVWGSITKIGNSISIDSQLIDISKTKSDIRLSSQSQTLDDIIPRINDFSEKLFIIFSEQHLH